MQVYDNNKEILMSTALVNPLPCNEDLTVRRKKPVENIVRVMLSLSSTNVFYLLSSKALALSHTTHSRLFQTQRVL